MILHVQTFPPTSEVSVLQTATPGLKLMAGYGVNTFVDKSSVFSVWSKIFDKCYHFHWMNLLAFGEAGTDSVTTADCGSAIFSVSVICRKEPMRVKVVLSFSKDTVTWKIEVA